MTWTKTADDFPDQMLDLSDAAYRLHHAATTYCNRVGTDGRLTRSRLGFVPVPPRTRRPGVIAELVAASLWLPESDGWSLTDFLESQLSADEVRLTTEYNRIRQAIRLCRDDTKRPSLRAEGEAVLSSLQAARELRRASVRSANRSANRIAPSRPVPVPTRPDPIRGRGRVTPTPEPDRLAAAGPCEICEAELLGRPWHDYVRSDDGKLAHLHDECFEEYGGRRYQRRKVA